MPNQSPNLEKKPKFSPKYILTVVILAVLAGGGILVYRYWWLPKQESKPPEITIQDHTLDWQTYRNEEYGFEIDYPTTWEVIPRSMLPGNPLVEFAKKDRNMLGDFSLSIKILDEKDPFVGFIGDDLPGWIKNRSEYNSPDHKVYEGFLPFAIANQFVNRVYYQPKGGGIPSEETFIGGNRYGPFHFTCLVSFEGYPDYTKYRSSGECDDILKTFKF